MRRAIAILALTISALAVSPAVSASGSTIPARDRAMNWAITQAGHWYCWGGSGGCYDCSGLVMAAYAHAGISLPHSTYSMLSSGKLRWVPRSLARRGDLAFYGSGHVELLTRWPGMTFGAETFGTQVGWHKWNIWWHPTAFYRVG